LKNDYADVKGTWYTSLTQNERLPGSSPGIGTKFGDVAEMEIALAR